MNRYFTALLALVFVGLLLMQGETLARSAAPAALDEIAVAALPSEAQQTLRLIRRGGPFPYQRDAAVFGNYEQRLPQRNRGYYHEYTVPTRGDLSRGARRIIAGLNREYYYTDDHYRSFKRIRE